MKKTIVSLAAGLVLAGTAATSVSAQEYQVQEGDTLSGLSQEFDVSVDDLKTWNDLDSDLIVVDQLLDIQDEDAVDNAVSQDAAPADDQADEEEAPADDQAAEQKEADSEENQPAEDQEDQEDQQEADENDEDEAVEQEQENDQAVQENADDQATEQEDPNAEAPQQEANNEDEAVEEQEQQEAPDDQAAGQEEVDQPEENKQEATNDDEEQNGDDETDGKTMTMSSTAYTAGCDGCSGTTADGTELSGDENVIAVDPDEIPIGSEVHVEGYGDAVAADTGGDINGDRVDLHMGDEDEAKDWGRQDVEVTVK